MEIRIAFSSYKTSTYETDTRSETSYPIIPRFLPRDRDEKLADPSATITKLGTLRDCIGTEASRTVAYRPTIHHNVPMVQI